MSNQPDRTIGQCQPTVYQIRIEGHLGSEWSDWFEDMTIILKEDGDTLLTGPVIDQAALFGLLKKVRDLGMPLLAVNRVESSQANALDDGEQTEASQLKEQI